MEFVHRPVLLTECMDGLNIKKDGVYVDGTVGGGGHSLGIVSTLGKQGKLVCIDQDEEALEKAKDAINKKNINDAKVIFEKSNFENLTNVCENLGIKSVDGILLDIGVSSYQLDNPKRGFSYNNDAVLDMRMNASESLNAEIILNEWPREDLLKIIRDYGEEKWASRIAKFICEARDKKRIETTFELVDIVKAAIPKKARQTGPHPAKRVFQAIRIAVNDELGVLTRVIDKGVELLSKEGRFCIITFHSLEDRLVKQGFSQMVNPCKCPGSFPMCICGKEPKAKLVSKKPIIPTVKEIDTNPRSRSAKLRILEKV